MENQASYVERDCTIEHEGRKFESGGAVVSEQFVIAYPGKDGQLNDWHGKQIGTYRVLSTWKTPRNWFNSTQSSMECWVNGVRYVGRGAGEGMILRAKRSPKQGPIVRLLECGSCGQFHPAGTFQSGGSANYMNDCRYDANRFQSDEDYTRRTGKPCVEVSLQDQHYFGDL